MIKIPQNDLRREVDSYFKNLCTWRRDKEAGIKPKVEFPEKVSGLDLVEWSDPEREPYFKCGQYVFYIRKGEHWISSHREPLPEDVQDRTIDALCSRGYSLVESPDRNDIVVYIKEHSLEAVHFGIWENDQITSKFGNSHIFSHLPEVVLSCYGDVILFLRK